MANCKEIYLKGCEFENSQVLKECFSCWKKLKKLQLYYCVIPNVMVDEIILDENLQKLTNASINVLVLDLSLEPDACDAWTQIKLFEAFGIEVHELHLELQWNDAAMKLMNYAKTTFGSKLKQLKFSLVKYDIHLANPFLEFLIDWQDLKLVNFGFQRNIVDCSGILGPPTENIADITDDSYAKLLNRFLDSQTNLRSMDFEPDDDTYNYPKAITTMSLHIIGGTRIENMTRRVYASDENLVKRITSLSLQTSNLHTLTLNLYMMNCRVLDLSCLSNLENLKYFHLKNIMKMFCPTVDFRDIGKTETVISFKLQNVAILDKSLQQIIVAMPNLEYLDLADANSVSMIFKFWKKKIWQKYSALQYTSAALLVDEGLGGLKRLRSLKIDGHRILYEVLEKMQLPYLTEFVIGHSVE
jgi:hypothetical protein